MGYRISLTVRLDDGVMFDLEVTGSSPENVKARADKVAAECCMCGAWHTDSDGSTIFYPAHRLHSVVVPKGKD